MASLMWLHSVQTSLTYLMQWKPATAEKSTAHCLASMIRWHWCSMFQSRISMLWLCPACVMMQVLQEKCTIRIILHYNATEGGMDNLDHLSTMYTTRRKVNRWHVVLFGNCIDVGAVAAFIIWLVNFPEWCHLRDDICSSGTNTGDNHATSPVPVPDTNIAGTDTFGNDDDWCSSFWSAKAGPMSSGCCQEENMVPVSSSSWQES